MKTVVLGSRPAELERLIERRAALGLDTFDEVWEGAYHMAPAGRSKHAFTDEAVAALLGPYAASARLIGSGPFNLGQPDNYRVPDRGYHRRVLDVVYFDTAAIAVEILSPDDESYEKLPFYAVQEVDEVFMVDPNQRRVTILTRQGDDYASCERSRLLGITVAEFERDLRWP